jgi:hypothetical protein
MWVGGPAGVLIDPASALDKNIKAIVPLKDYAFRSLVVLLATGCLFVLVKIMHRRDGAGTVLLAVTSLAVVPVWYVIFRNHTTVHAWFMVRLLAWPMAFSVSLIVWWIVSALTGATRSVSVNRHAWTVP